MHGMKGMRYKLPKMDKEKENDMPEMVYPDMYDRRVSIPVNDEILEYAEIGEECHITLTGKISEIRSNKSEEGYEHKTITLEISEVEKYGEYEANDSFKKGMNRMMKKY